MHGFNGSFDEAVASAAEIVNCMRSNVVPFVVSWPSARKMTSYFEDEESVSASRERLRLAIRSLLDQPHFDRVTIVAHSMGTRLVMRVLADLQLQGTSLKALSRVVFVAPDIAEAEFLELWPRLVKLRSR